MALTARYPALAFTASAVTASSERLAPAIAVFWLWTAERSPPSVMASTLAIVPALTLTMTF
jgi:hypothetical protein